MFEVTLSSMGICFSASTSIRCGSFCADVDRTPYAARSLQRAAGLAGMRCEAEPGLARLRIVFLEERGGPARLIAADADADDGRHVRPQLGGLAKDARGFIRAEVADGVDEPVDG